LQLENNKILNFLDLTVSRNDRELELGTIINLIIMAL